MMGIVNRIVRHRCACGGNFELIAFDDVLVVRGDVGTRQVAERRKSLLWARDGRVAVRAPADDVRAVTSVCSTSRLLLSAWPRSTRESGRGWGELPLRMNHHFLLFARRCAARRLVSSTRPYTFAKTLSSTSALTSTRFAMAPKRKRTAADNADEVEAVIVATGSALVSTPEEARALIRRTSTRRKKKVVYTEEVQDAEWEKPEADEAFDGPLTDIDDEPAEKSPKKRRRRTKTQEPVVYDIPPVETKSTDFKGMCVVAYSPSRLMGK